VQGRSVEAFLRKVRSARSSALEASWWQRDAFPSYSLISISFSIVIARESDAAGAVLERAKTHEVAPRLASLLT
jgi:hypothetical protein